MTYDEYVNSSTLNTDVIASSRAGLLGTRTDMYHAPSAQTFSMPMGSSLSVLNRESMVPSMGNNALFGQSVIADEREMPEIIQTLGQGLEDFVAGAGTQVTGVFTRFPAVMLQEFSDLIGDRGREFEGVAGQVFTHIDNIADEMSVSLMDAYYETLDSNGWAFGEGEEPSFMFKLGSGAASLAEAIGITLVTGNPVAAAAFFGALQQTETYTKAIAAGKSPGEAFAIANTAGITMGLLERIGIKMLMKTAADPAKRFAQRTAQGAFTEGIQEGSQEASVIGIEGITGVDSMSGGEALSQIGESALIGGILGGVATPATGAFIDRQQAKNVRAGRVDQKVIDELIQKIDANLQNEILTENATWMSAKMENPNTEAGKRLKQFQNKVIEIVNSNLNGQQFQNVFRTEKQQREYMKNIVAKMRVANEAETKAIATSKLKDIKTRRKKLSVSQSELEKAGALVVQKYSKKFDNQPTMAKYMKSIEGKSTSEALIVMRKELRAVRKAKREATGEELIGPNGLNAQEQSLEDTIDSFELLDKQQFAEFDDKGMFEEGLEELSSYKKISREARVIEDELAEQEREYQEWSEKTSQPEIYDFVKNERISMTGEALRKLTKDQAVDAFYKGVLSGRKQSEAYFVDAIKHLNKWVKSMPALKGTVISEKGKQEIANKLNTMAQKLNSGKMSREQIETQEEEFIKMFDKMIDVARNMTAESAYKLYKSDLKKMLKKHKKLEIDAEGKAITRTKKLTKDADLNTVLKDMKAIMSSKEGRDKIVEKLEGEYGNMYRPMIDKLYQILEQEDAGTLDTEQLAESYAGMLDAVDYMVNYGYVPDARYIARAAQLQATKLAMSNYDESQSNKRLGLIRKSKVHAVADGFFNFNFETLNTLWVKLGLENVELLDLTKSDMGFRNDKVRWTHKIRDIGKKLNLTKKNFESWNSVESEEEYILGGEVHKLTKAMVMQRVMNLKNEDTRKMAMDPKGLNYSAKEIDALEGSLRDSENENKFVDEIMKFYQEIFNEVSPVYRNLYLIDMPKVKNYSPTPRKSNKDGGVNINDVSFLGPNGLAIPSFAKKRTRTQNPFMDVGIIDTLTHYVESASYFVNYQERISDINNLLSDENVQRGIVKAMGTRGLTRLKAHIDYIKDMPKRHGIARNELWDHLNKVYIVNKLMFKPNQIFKQFSSAFGLIEDVPASYAGPRISRMFNPLHHRRWKKIFQENETFRSRSEHIDADYNLLLNNDTIGIFTEQGKIVKAGMSPTVMGDIKAIVAGGGLYYDYLVDKKGMSKEEALDTVIRKAEMSQQSSLPSNMTLLQKDQGAFARTIRMFSSSSVALINMQMQAWAKYRAGEISRAQFFKNMALYQFVVPSFYALMAGQISFDDGDELAWGLMHAGMKGNYGSLPIVGEGIDALTIQAVNSMSGAELTSYGIRDIENPLGEFYKITMKGMKAVTGEEDFTEEEIAKIVFELIDSTARLGSENVFNGIMGATELVGESDPAGLLRIFGYSEKTADKLTGNK